MPPFQKLRWPNVWNASRKIIMIKNIFSRYSLPPFITIPAHASQIKISTAAACAMWITSATAEFPFFIIWKAIPLWNQSRASNWNQSENAHAWNYRCTRGQRNNGSRRKASRRGPRLSFPGISLHSNLFLDSLDEIKRQVDGDGCQEETESFFSAACRWQSGLQIWLEGCRPLGEGQWLSNRSRACFCCVTDNTDTHSHCCSEEHKCLSGDKISPLIAKQ